MALVRFMACLLVATATTSVFAEDDEVLIYYANETAPSGAEDDNYDRIVGWLRSEDRPALARIADSLEQDRQIFQKAVDVEIYDLATELPRLESGPELIVFDNRLVREGKCLVWKRDGGKAAEKAFPTHADQNYILSGSPLSKPETMRQALAFVAEEFDPGRHKFVLITKSHGSDSKAITPRLTVRAEETSRAELLKVAVGEVETDQLPDWAGKLGISKAEYINILEHAGETLGMRFSLVYLEACNALVGSHLQTVPSNVDRLLLLSRDAHYINLLYPDLAKSIAEAGSLADSIVRNLPPKFVLLGHGDDIPVEAFHTPYIARWVYFMPLCAWIGWMGWQMAQKNKAPRP